MIRVPIMIGLLLASAAVACEDPTPSRSAPIDDDTYVIVMGELADLQRFPPDGPDLETRTALADSARLAILDRHGVSPDDMLGYAEAVGGDPEHMEEVAERIVALTDSLAQQRVRRDAPIDVEVIDSAVVERPTPPRGRRGVGFDSATLERMRREHPIELDPDPDP